VSEAEAPQDARIRVLLVDDHHVFRTGLRAMLEQHEILEVVGDVPTGGAAVGVVERRHPDVVLTDLNMPGMDGVEATRMVRARAPKISVVVLTVAGTEDAVIDALGAGAVGYLLKDATAQDVIEAAHRGGSVLSPAVARMVIERSRRTMQDAPTHEAVEALSERELSVLRLVAEGKENTEIAEALFISQTTVKRDTSSAMAKLGATNRLQAAIKAVRSGLI